MLKAIFGGSRFVVSLAVLGTFVGSVLLQVIATLTILRLAWEEFANFRADGLNPRRVDHLGVQFIQIVDIVLLGTVLYIISVGLYQLFIDPELPVPRWLRVHNLTELKRDLISVTVVLLGVTFLGEAVDWSRGDTSILFLGAGSALVVAALGLILWLTPENESHGDHDPE
ncbi:MAG: YqhA family protein [Thermomicrobiales bacterium]|nr:YqhA family protein [Thermomicrobiales bacterium]